MGNVRDAAAFALGAHQGQKYGSQPYSYHLAKVFQNAQKYGGSSTEQAAAWLHDVVEDTTVTTTDIARKFGSDIAKIVDLVSNRGSKEATFNRIRSDRRAVFVKLCDRLANVSEGAKNSKYRKEHPIFKSILYKKGEFDALWKAIDGKLGV